MDDHNKEQKMNTSFTNVRSKEDGSKISLTSTNAQSDQKHLESLKHDPVQTSNTTTATLDSSKENKTIAKVNVHITKSDTSPSERDSKSLQNGGTKDGKLPHVENSTQSVDKMKDKVETKQTDRGSGDSRKSADDSNDLSKKNAQENMNVLTRNKSHKRIEETSQKMERLNHSLQATSKVEEERTKQRHKDQQKDQANTESRALQDKNNTEIKQTKPKSIKPRDNATSSLIHNSTSVTLANKKDSENSQHPHGKSMKVNKEDHRISPVKSMESHKEKSENPKIAKKTKSGVTNDPGSGVTHVPVAHETGSGVTHDPGSDVTNDPGSSVTHDPESNVTKEPGGGVTHDPESDVTHEPGSGVTHAPGSGATHSPENLSIDPVITNHHSKRVSRHETLKDPHSPDKKSSKQKLASTRSTKKPSQADLDNVKSLSTPHTNDAKNGLKETTKHRGIATSSYSKSRNFQSDDKTEPTKMQSDSSRTDPNPATKEEIKPSKTEQVEVMTSRTPPTSLLTTSNDDNTYSIKQIVQGPKGSSYVYGSHGDEKVHSLEKKVFKLENEVTVLETAMANLAKRLLVVEQKSDLGTTPQNPLPQYGPERIVIPISSLYSGGAGRVSTHSAAIHEVVDSQEAKVDSHPDEEGQEKSQDSTHVTLRDGALSSPISEAHAVVRPIVNIIVPNSRADLLSGGALCIPRCQNGGRCLDRNTCRCPTFFTGDHCERFSLRDLLESPNPRVRPYRKLQRVVVSEPPDRQLLDGTLNLDSASPALEYRDLNQDLEPGKEFVAKQQPVEIASP
ncbi:hypothetical protein OS493_011120 [Desmophyllum pertusum]|uniref:EGF-like domain-containing protein n=1 Tax=Desmophyllum pertusum TaxID=174260 RepID=A0A9W9Z1Y3_9CNID|nr:hypothetical protein OS493_011120 [Desmophyllum pertusum]